MTALRDLWDRITGRSVSDSEAEEYRAWLWRALDAEATDEERDMAARLGQDVAILHQPVRDEPKDGER